MLLHEGDGRIWVRKMFEARKNSLLAVSSHVDKKSYETVGSQKEIPVNCNPT